MATSTVAALTCGPKPSAEDPHPGTAKPKSRATPALELVREDEPSPRRIAWRLSRGPGGLELSGTCLPAPEGTEIEVCAGAARRRAPVASGGSFRIGGLPECPHANVVIRGGGLPAIALLKLPVD